MTNIYSAKQGPQYVCTNFWTFVCTTCSGIHREFTHRVKSVSMAKFTSQEVSALQGGGNQCAKEIYFKEWDPQRHSIPDSSNIERLRDFIKHVYVDRRYSGEKNIDRPPRVKMVDREDSYTYHSGSRSPVYEDIPERPYGEGQKYGDYKRSPARFEVVDDRLRDDRLGNRRFEDNRSSDGEAKPEGRSPSHRRELYPSSPPVVRPVRDILGEDVPPLRVGEHPKAYGGRASDGSAQTQRSVSSSSLGSS
ncbi:hypothetical protein L1049_003685 [Liquidambar formosana]|uniref:Arf-GAP domain-containing protein n=1 Tax=Liquidambar formosana TaxID=63359 RepID=A0AAP0WXR6_LIQFO